MLARLGAALLPALLAGTALAERPPQLAWPVDCRPGIDCFIQNYVDTDPGPEARDFTCGPLSYDGHDGTDIRIANFAQMRRGVEVRAAAAGRVLSVRDAIPDTGWKEDEKTGERRLCGNGVLIAHGDGWTTQYCHMKKGSIAVAREQQVAAGQRLGEIGFSGKTAFPHLHFTVRTDNTPLDPFTGRVIDEGCGARQGDRTLWSEAPAAPAYQANGLLGAGFAERAPARVAVQDGHFASTQLPASAPALVFWVEIFGLRQGDVEEMRLLDASGEVLAESVSEPAARHRAVQFRFLGKRRRGEAWPAGDYRGEYRLLRAAADSRKEVLKVERILRVR